MQRRHFAAIALPHIKSGKAVALAVTSATRSSQLPDVPTVAESGVAGTKNFEAVGWLGLMAPSRRPPRRRSSTASWRARPAFGALR